MTDTPARHGRKLRILFVTLNLDKGGLEEMLLMFARFLDKSAYELAVACRVEGIVAAEMARLPGVRVFGYEREGRLARFSALLRFAREFKPDIIHNHFSWYGVLLGLLLRVPRVETIHNIYSWFTGIQRVAYSLHCLLASRVIAVSETVRQFTVAHFPLLRWKRIDVVHNGTDTKRFSGESDGALRSAFGIPSSHIVMGFIGRLEEQKGLPYLLQALARLRDESVPDYSLMIVGDGTLREFLKSEAERLNLSNVHFAGYQRETPAFFRLFDVFVFPSLFEGLPVVLIEAMAAGCAVVSTTIGSVAELVVHGKSGLLVSPKDPDALASALKMILTNEALRAEMGQQAQLRANSEFSVDAMVNRTEDIYRSIAPGAYRGWVA